MLLNIAARERKAPNALTTSAPEPPFYADDLLPALQSTLASLADVDVRYEIERELGGVVRSGGGEAASHRCA
jgi:hypothetical protein